MLFTGRRATQRFLVEHLAADLGLPKGAVVGGCWVIYAQQAPRCTERIWPRMPS